MKICICASLKFLGDIRKVSDHLTSLSIVNEIPDLDLPKELHGPDNIPYFVFAHFEKIDRADAIFVVNPGGYVGNSTKVEIGYARGSGKKVFFLEKTGLPELDCLSHEVVSFENLHLITERK